MPSPNLKDIAEVYCEGCTDVLCHDKDNPPPIKECFDRLIELEKTIALREIAKRLNDSINVWTRNADKESIIK
jgi:hypothetical protein